MYSFDPPLSSIDTFPSSDSFFYNLKIDINSIDIGLLFSLLFTLYFHRQNADFFFVCFPEGRYYPCKQYVAFLSSALLGFWLSLKIEFFRGVHHLATGFESILLDNQSLDLNFRWAISIAK
ncbi:hypothetical protein TNCV_2360711 [Trichonephila clavipes]|nr:hypothetical protein TNCV_2360711 [Trichonephila clavipes]